MTGAARVALALGSNLGDRQGRLVRAVEALSDVVEVDAVSSVYASAAAGYADQPDFLNAVVVGRTSLDPHLLLARALAVEREAGRERTFRNAPRTLDVDVILYGDRVLSDPTLRIPHPRYRERAFVLAPLAEADPELVDPETGQTVQEIWNTRRDELPEVRIAAPPDVLWPPWSGNP